MKKIFYLLLMSFLYCSMIQAQDSDKTEVIRDYFEAYNEQNIEKVMGIISDNFRMYSVTSDTVTLDIGGRKALRKWLNGYFEDFTDVYSGISNINETGNYVTFIETAHWGENKSQSSLAVYEVLKGRIHRVWYYYR